MTLHQFLRAMPKVSLHCHLEGSVRAATVVDLARKHGVGLPAHREPEEIYDYPDILAFLAMYDVVAHVVRDEEDFRRITYETLREASEHAVRHREMFWSPLAHMDVGVPYATAQRGIVTGIRDAERDFGIQCRLIADINRMRPPEDALELVEAVLAHRCEELIGVGMDYAEGGHPPEQFWKAYRAAKAGGMRLTAHACEDGPPRNIETCLDLLGCERIDHGYHVMDDPKLVERCAREGVIFNCTPVSTAWVYFGPDFTVHPVKRMAEAGLKITVDCDDPPMFKTDPTRDYVVMADHMGFGPEDFRGFVMNSIDGCWLDERVKRRMRREWALEIDRLAAQVEPSPKPSGGSPRK